MASELINPDLWRMLEERLLYHRKDLATVMVSKSDLLFLNGWHRFGKSLDGRSRPIIQRQSHVMDLSVRGVACIVAWYFGAIDRSFDDLVRFLNSCALSPSEQCGLFPYYETSKSTKPSEPH